VHAGKPGDRDRRRYRQGHLEVRPEARTAEHVTCRGVGYYDIDKDASLDAAQKAAYTEQACRRRILVSTVDARLFALDAATGARSARASARTASWT
jgi:glucose dehydrogenase